MRILAIGDFNGKFPKKLLDRVKREDFDLIVSPGDFCYDRELDRLFFRYAYGTGLALSSFIGKKRSDMLEKRSLNAGFRVIRKLNSFGKPIIAVTGNWDPVDFEEIGMPKFRDPNSKKFKTFVKRMKNIRLIDFKRADALEASFVGYPRSTYPGKPEHKVFDKRYKDNRRYFNMFKRLVDKNTIFISHNCPYMTSLDTIKSSKGGQMGRHYGSYLSKKIILELRPRLVICGHMHENQGMQRVGKTIVINAGAAYENKAAIIDVETMKVRFIR